MRNAAAMVTALLLSCLFSSFARAGALDFNFSVTNATGPAGPSTVDGSFSVPAQDIGLPGLFHFDSFSFNWNSRQYNAENTEFVYINLDSTGNVSTAIFGNHCVYNFCSQGPGTNQWFAYYVKSLAPQFQFLDYSSSSDPSGYWSGNLSISTAPLSAVPEPGAGCMFLIGLSCIILARRGSRPRSVA